MRRQVSRCNVSHRDLLETSRETSRREGPARTRTECVSTSCTQKSSPHRDPYNPFTCALPRAVGLGPFSIRYCRRTSLLFAWSRRGPTSHYKFSFAFIGEPNYGQGKEAPGRITGLKPVAKGRTLLSPPILMREKSPAVDRNTNQG